MKRSRLRNLFSVPHSTLFVHYSCESFYDRNDGKSPRITSIAIRFLGSGQTKSFSIHQQAELSNLTSDGIAGEYDTLEKEMLQKFYLFVEQFAACNWIHWNMRDANYGFEAIAHRFRVLGGVPKDILDANKVDLARLILDLLGPNYVAHPRFQKLLEINDMVPRNFLAGAEEAEAFQNGDYVRLHQSTLSKVDAIMNLSESLIDDKLQSNNGYFRRRGLTPTTAVSILKEHPIYIAATFALGLLVLLADILKVFDA